MRKYSILVHVSHESHGENIPALFKSLVLQTYSNFEVIVVEECEGDKCDVVASSFKNELDIKYYNKKEAGEGYSRNFGLEASSGDYFILVDPFSIIPPDYLSIVEEALNSNYLDSYIGPVKPPEKNSFLQKAIFYSFNNYSVELRRDKHRKDMLPFYVGNINMGFSREVFEKTKGYLIADVGEDLEFWIRIRKSGFKEGVISTACIYRNTEENYKDIFRKMFLLGKARMNVYRFFPEELKPIHFVPASFLFFLLVVLISSLISYNVFMFLCLITLLYFLFVLLDSALKNNSLIIGFFTVPAITVQWSGYAVGFLSELYKEISGTKKKV